MDDILQSFVQWPALWMAARLGDLVLIQTWLPLLCKSSCFNANEWHLIEKIREVFIKARSPPGPLAFIYQVTEQTTIKWQVFSSASCSAMVSSYVTCQEKLGDNPLTQKWRSDGQAQSSARVYQNVFRVNCSLTLKKLFLMLKLFNVSVIDLCQCRRRQLFTWCLFMMLIRNTKGIEWSLRAFASSAFIFASTSND